MQRVVQDIDLLLVEDRADAYPPAGPRIGRILVQGNIYRVKSQLVFHHSYRVNLQARSEFRYQNHLLAHQAVIHSVNPSANESIAGVVARPLINHQLESTAHHDQNQVVRRVEMPTVFYLYQSRHGLQHFQPLRATAMWGRAHLGAE